MSRDEHNDDECRDTKEEGNLVSHVNVGILNCPPRGLPKGTHRTSHPGGTNSVTQLLCIRVPSISKLTSLGL